ncbi:uncharacterized protein TRIADDRAFT_26381 [Trichoplax adhaerens]|uniref:Peptidase M13 N-terminal domain-containing protein n=1 Tax=Trichoplax adhaerens TaxID=10228 RepID=B3RZU8_TRIAD|nr:hypothetical protein TRIADDRAFT_26381 [Trichoplax adhaerens]EDV23905.1 hypothetical protein TRIADDRAFT_26381 [Trichoplax adhaerens]|eukprot:XP_002113431.1 hypothetical protein TRIADDRAFT_26381 [Trichoplax adhaerens]
MEEHLQGYEYSKVRVIKGLKDRNLVGVLALLVVLLLIGLVVAVVVLRQNKSTGGNTASNSSVCTESYCYTTSAEILSTINTSVNPCDDFFQYACGTWMANHDIPDDRSRYMTFTVVSERNEKILRKLLSTNVSAQSGVGEQKVVGYYQSCFNDIYTEKASRLELIKRIGMLGGWSAVPSIMIVNLNTWNFNQTLAKIASGYDINPFFSIWVSSDLKDAKTTIIEMTQGGITLPGVRFYTYNETHSAVVALIEYMTEVATLLGATNRTKTMEKMTEVYRFEKRLARAYISNLNLENEAVRYNKVMLSQVKAACPAIDFNQYVNLLFGRTIPNTQPVVNYAMNYFKRMSAIISNTSKETLNNYLIWHFVKTFTSAADSKLLRAYQKYREALYGKATPSPQWRTCVYRANAALGMASGAMFVRHSFNGQSRTTAHSMVQGIRSAFLKALPSLNWMDAQTRKVAAEKANAIHDQIGYPDFILNEAQLAQFYSNFPVNESYYFINVIARRIYAMKVNLDQLGKPFNKNRWSMTPSTVNAYYSANRNQIEPEIVI